MSKFKDIANALLFCVFLVGLLTWSLIKPDDEISVSERRKLAKMPALSAASVFSGSFMKDFDSYCLDQFPLRDRFRQLKAVTSFYVFRQKDNNGIYISSGHASKLDYPINESSLEYAKERISNIYDSYLSGTGSKAYICVIPDKNCFMAKQGGYPSMDYAEFADIFKQGMQRFEYIDIYDLLELDDYYKTDTHWRQERISDVAERLAENMGAKYDGGFSEVPTDIPFYGVYYGQSALPLKADALSYMQSDFLSGCRVYDYESESEAPVYNMELANGNDPYDIFLSGPISLITIENPDALTDRELIIFRDSFGSSIAPLLAQSYKKITLVDIRYLSSSLVGRFVEFSGQDVLFLYSMSVLNNSETMK